MTPTARAIAFWILRVAVAVLLVLVLRAWQGPDPVLWWLWGGYAAISLLTTLFVIRRNADR